MVVGEYDKAYQAHIRRWGVGATLRGAREAGGETIPEAARATRIRAEYLYALENEDFQSLPGWAYALSYVRTYADYLGLEPLPLVKKVRERVELRQHLGRPPARVERRPRTWRPAVAIMVAVAMAIGAGFYFAGPIAGLASVFDPVPRAIKTVINRTFFTVAENGEPTDEQEIMALSAQAEASPPASAFDDPGISAAPIPSSTSVRFAPLRDQPAPSDKVVIATHPRGAIDRVEEPEVQDIVVRARAPVWLEVKDAVGRNLLSKQLGKGELYRLPTGVGFTVSTDDAGALEVYVQGALAGLIGPAGSPVSELPVDRLTGVRADG